jgi:hypothetical protein
MTFDIKKHTAVSLFSGCGGMDLGFAGDFTVFGKHFLSRDLFR